MARLFNPSGIFHHPLPTMGDTDELCIEKLLQCLALVDCCYVFMGPSIGVYGSMVLLAWTRRHDNGNDQVNHFV